MIAEYNTKSTVGIGVGLALQFVGAVTSGNGRFGVVLIAIGGLVFVYGCTLYALAKGYSAIVGLLGLLGLLGLVILLVMPDRATEDEAAPPPMSPT